MTKIQFEKYYTLGELEDLGLIKLGRGKVISRNDIRDNPGNYPIYSSSALNNGKMGSYNEYLFDKEQITWSIDGGGMFFYREKHKYSITNVSGWLDVVNKNCLNIKFLYYSLINAWSFKVYDYTNKAHPSVIRNDYNIFIPNIEVQNELARILDKFTVLEAELEAELEARITQYEYYRDELLTFDDSVEKKSLRELGELIRGVGLQKKHLLDDGVPAVHYGQIYTYYGTFADKTLSFVSKEYSKKLRKAEKGDILISGVSESIEDICTPVGWFGDEVCISGDMFAFRHSQNTKFITYMLKTTDFSRYKEKYAQGAKVTRLSRDRLLDYEIPVPSLEEQERIVSMLDKFSSLVTDIKEGLPAEIELRRQQYEYYRNKLLTFESEV